MNRKRIPMLFLISALLIYLISAGLYTAFLHGYIRVKQNVTFTLSDKILGPEEEIRIEFSKPLKPFGDQFFALSIVYADYPDDVELFWHGLNSGDSRTTVKGPKTTGVYKVLLKVCVYGKYCYTIHREELYVVEGDGKTIPPEANFDKDLHVKFTLEKEIITTEEKPKTYFSVPLNPRDQESYEMTIVPKGSSDDCVYALMNSWPPRGATEFLLVIRLEPGLHEVRMFARYPYNMQIIHREPLLVVPANIDISGFSIERDPESDLKVTFALDDPTITTVDELKIRFSKPLVPRGGERYWIAIVPSEREDSVQGSYATYLDFGIMEKRISKIPETPGNYEVRLHARYSTEYHHVIHRENLELIYPGPERSEQTE